MALIPILVITLAVLVALGHAPGGFRRLTGPHLTTLAVALPILGTFGGSYALFAFGVILLIMTAPGVSRGGLAVPLPADIETRARLFIFALPMMPLMTYTVTIAGLTFAQFTYVNLLSIGFLLAMLRAGSVLRDPRFARWDLLMAIMLTVQFFMDSRGTHATFAIRAAMIVALQLGVPYFAVSRACRQARAPDMLLLAFVAAGVILAAMTPVESIRHWLFYENMPQYIHADPEVLSGYTKQRDGLLRAHVTYGESTGLSLLLGLLIVMLVALRQQVGSRMTLAAAIACVAVGLVFTFARVGYIVVVAGLPACFAYERRWRQLLLLALALPFAAVALLLASHVVPALAASIGTSEDAGGSVSYRSMLFHAGIQLVRENWLTGLPLRTVLDKLAFLQTGEQIVDLVNQPLVIFMRAGVFGGIAYFAMFVSVIVALYHRAPRMDAAARATGCACFAGLIGVMASLTTTSYGRNEITVIVLLACAAGVLSRTPRAVRAPSAVRPIIARASLRSVIAVIDAGTPLAS